MTDVPLTARGERQATALATRIGNLEPALVLSSPRVRARRTADLAGLRVDDIDPNLAEWNYGEYEGRTSAEIREQVPGWTLFTHGAPGGETADEVAERADRVLARAVDALPRGPVVLIGHGHFSRVLGARWIGMGPNAAANLLLDAAATSVLSSQYGARAIECWNVTDPRNEGDR